MCRLLTHRRAILSPSHRMSPLLCVGEHETALRSRTEERKLYLPCFGQRDFTAWSYLALWKVFGKGYLGRYQLGSNRFIGIALARFADGQRQVVCICNDLPNECSNQHRLSTSVRFRTSTNRLVISSGIFMPLRGPLRHRFLPYTKTPILAYASNPLSPWVLRLK